MHRGQRLNLLLTRVLSLRIIVIVAAIVLLTRRIRDVESDGARQRIEEQRKAGSLRAEARAALDVQMIRDLEQQLQGIVKVLDGTEAPQTGEASRGRAEPEPSAT